MIHTDVYRRFEDSQPSYAKQVAQWWPNGRNSIRIRLKNEEEFIFSILEDNSFQIESIDSFLIRLKGGSVMKC